MTHFQRFLWVVQTGAMAAEVNYLLALHYATTTGTAPPAAQKNAVDVVARATQIDEEAVGPDSEVAARQFLLYAYGKEPAPRWYDEWRELSDVEW
jgi:hypothetical protein